MSDLIDREKAIEAIIAQNGNVDKSVAKRILMQLPSAEPKKGKWIKENRVLTFNPPQYVWHCSECGTSVYGFSSGILTPYCSKCGAKMEVTE